MERIVVYTPLIKRACVVLLIAISLCSCNETKKSSPDTISGLSTTTEDTKINTSPDNTSQNDIMEKKYVQQIVYVREGRGMGYSIVDSLHNGDSVQVGRVAGSWAPIYNDGKFRGYIYASLLKNTPKALPNSIASTYSPKVTPSASSTVHNSIRGTDNGYHWNNTEREAKLSICKDLAKRIGRRDAQFYFDALEDFYDTADPINLNLRLQMTVAEVAGLCSVM